MEFAARPAIERILVALMLALAAAARAETGAIPPLDQAERQEWFGELVEDGTVRSISSVSNKLQYGTAAISAVIGTAGLVLTAVNFPVVAPAASVLCAGLCLALPVYISFNSAAHYEKARFRKVLGEALKDIDALIFELPELRPQLLMLLSSGERRNFHDEGILQKSARLLLPLLLHLPYLRSVPRPRNSFYWAWAEQSEDWVLEFDRFLGTSDGADWFGRFEAATENLRKALWLYLELAYPVPTRGHNDLMHFLRASKQGHPIPTSEWSKYVVKRMSKSNAAIRDLFLDELARCEALIARYR